MSDAAAGQPAASWTTLLSATFRILASVATLQVSCTGWFAAPRRHTTSMHVSVYVTAGHCSVPQVVRTADGFEQMMIVARVTRPGMDATVGLRLDPRSPRTFPALATAPPRLGDRALVAGYSAGHLTEAVITAIDDCPAEFLCFHSDQVVHPGMSGAPILSLRTGDIVGILVATVRHARGYEDPHTIMATPAASLRSLIEMSAPGTLPGHLSLPHAACGHRSFCGARAGTLRMTTDP